MTNNNTNAEIWKDIKGFETLYQVSNLGRVRSLDRYVMRAGVRVFIKGKIVSAFFNKKDGYLRVELYKFGKRHKRYIHKLVAEAFLGANPNPAVLTQINHKNEIKTDNRPENLEYCSQLYNLNYGTRNQRISEAKGKPVIQKTKDGKFVAKYKSAVEAGAATGINCRNIAACARGAVKSAGKFVWSYAA